jgi:hypothetical protein
VHGTERERRVRSKPQAADARAEDRRTDDEEEGVGAADSGEKGAAGARPREQDSRGQGDDERRWHEPAKVQRRRVPGERPGLPAAVGVVLVGEPGRRLPDAPVDDDRRVEEQSSPGLLVAKIEVVVLVCPEPFVPAADRARPLRDVSAERDVVDELLPRE